MVAPQHIQMYDMKPAYCQVTGQRILVRVGEEIGPGTSKPGLGWEPPKEPKAPVSTDQPPKPAVSEHSEEQLKTLTVEGLRSLPEWDRVADKSAKTKDAMVAEIMKVRSSN